MAVAARTESGAPLAPTRSHTIARRSTRTGQPQEEAAMADTDDDVPATDDDTTPDALEDDELEGQPSEKLLKALREERKTARNATREAGELRVQVEELGTRAEQAESLLADLTRQFVAAEHNLPPALADRLRGSTPAELDADAAELAALLPTGVDFDGGSRVTVPHVESPERAHGRLVASMLRGGDPYEDR
jgi:hypothetical protein